MSNTLFDMDEFIRKDGPVAPTDVEAVEEEAAAPELDVQKAVVESLAADKAKLDEDLAKKDDTLAKMKAELETLKAELESKTGAADALASEVVALKRELAAEKAKKIDLQERNPNALALLDRDIELPDRFPGETRDHVLEVIREARERAEAEGRLRRAQVLEAVLLANEPNGTLAKEREELTKIFADNGNILSGSVLEELTKRGISHKNGENYLLPDEILKRTY